VKKMNITVCKIKKAFKAYLAICFVSVEQK